MSNMTAAQKLMDGEMSRQIETRWEYEHQTKRTKDYEVEMEKITNDVAKLRSYLPMISETLLFLLHKIKGKYKCDGARCILILTVLCVGAIFFCEQLMAANIALQDGC